MKIFPFTPTSAKQAFSLVELSIVLVILGLLVGGVLSGQSLIRAAELRGISSDFQRYQSAAHSFRDRYMAVPGDMANATAFWSQAANCSGDSNQTVIAGTCNGDGDGDVNKVNGASRNAEIFQFWKQLALARLVEGTYSGIAGSGSSYHAIPGSNVPRGRISNAGWAAGTNRSYAGDATVYKFEYGSHFVFGLATADHVSRGPALKPEEAWSIDTKLDDGKPAQGNIIAMYWNNLCAKADDGSHANDDLVASYKLEDSSLQCALFFTNTF
jgi:prepilin-type N-terminal cleavage/methylation domain-containing protein